MLLRMLPIAAVLALAACTTPPRPVADTPAAGQCNADAARRHVGKPATAATVQTARTDAGASTARILKPGQMVTMEYQADRLNLDVDAANVITNVRCG